MTKNKKSKSKNKEIRPSASLGDGKKIKVVAYCDSPSCATGFGTVSRNIFEGLMKTGRYDIDILGINYWGNPHPFPYKIWPTGTNQEQDPYGRKKICNMIPRMEFELLFFLQDTFIMDFLPELTSHLKNQGKKFKSICYFPVDGTPKEQWIKNISVVDYPTCYGDFAYNEAKKAYADCPDFRKIPHGVSTRDFYPRPEEEMKEFRKQYFHKHHEKFVVTNVNRNQPRKDIPRTIAAFHEFRKHVPDSILYLHMAMKDQGWNLPEICRSYGFSMKEDIIFPENFSPNQGYPLPILNMVYNISDVIISTTVGEGWGLSWIEAMATKTPIIMPRNTAIAENITEDRGYLVDSGTNPNLFTILPHDNEVIRPLVDVEDLVAKMLHVYNNRDEAKKKAEAAYAWVCTRMDWQNSVVPQWVDLFDEAYDSMHTEKAISFGTEKAEKVIDTEVF